MKIVIMKAVITKIVCTQRKVPGIGGCNNPRQSFTFLFWFYITSEQKLQLLPKSLQFAKWYFFLNFPKTNKMYRHDFNSLRQMLPIQQSEPRRLLILREERRHTKWTERPLSHQLPRINYANFCPSKPHSPLRIILVDLSLIPDQTFNFITLIFKIIIILLVFSFYVCFWQQYHYLKITVKRLLLLSSQCTQRCHTHIYNNISFPTVGSFGVFQQYKYHKRKKSPTRVFFRVDNNTGLSERATIITVICMEIVHNGDNVRRS